MWITVYMYMEGGKGKTNINSKFSGENKGGQNYIYIYINDNYLVSQEPTYYFALLSIEHFSHCSLAALTVFFFLLTNQLRVFWFFFQLVWQGWPFLFFSNVSPWQWFVVYFHLQITCRFFSFFFLTIRAII